MSLIPFINTLFKEEISKEQGERMAGQGAPFLLDNALRYKITDTLLFYQGYDTLLFYNQGYRYYFMETCYENVRSGCRFFPRLPMRAEIQVTVNNLVFTFYITADDLEITAENLILQRIEFLYFRREMQNWSIGVPMEELKGKLREILGELPNEDNEMELKLNLCKKFPMFFPSKVPEFEGKIHEFFKDDLSTHLVGVQFIDIEPEVV